MGNETQAAICESLETLSQAEEYYRLLRSLVDPYIRGKTLEVGAGNGNFARWAKQSASEYHVSDADPELVRTLQDRFETAFHWNIFAPFPKPELYYDTVISFNVLEHLEDDAAAVRILSDRLVPGGHLILMVPAHPALFGSLDRAFGHFRRYNKKSFADLIQTAPLRILKSEYVNFIGMFGWLLFGRILRRDKLPRRLVSCFDFFLPLLKIERPLTRFAGISLIGVAEK